MYFQIQFLKHFLTASNQHGIHSPFVYDFVTKCLYAKPKVKASKSTQVLLKSISYFSVENFKVISKDLQIENLIQKKTGLKANQGNPMDLIYFDSPQDANLSIYKKNIQNNTIIIIDNIHKNKYASEGWKTMIKNKMVTVSIDMLYCGLVSFRTEQVKEHFKIRI